MLGLKIGGLDIFYAYLGVFIFLLFIPHDAGMHAVLVVLFYHGSWHWIGC